ncbi:DUF4398 domain-containing protein [Corallococcus sp. CA049B]|uniref:DUF4398 domain-containing protein n=1 Tax=Corallococcus sp. CA049B TaxID=2316730 RepID=UPI000EA3E1FD|nr:DUF4398 domain-containing protein [Corallococcus sp. CA049B]NOJ94034.1 DUF4398 domain-containing protein [Corallococcus coralloides]RKG87895.1 DUF4398 domain-containing protein [Corallococcus sp. CA049B]
MRPKLFAAALLCVAALGCAGKQVIATSTHQQRVQAEAALRSAENSQAPNVPEAARHLQFARQQIADGERLIQEGEQEAAELRFRQAAADADLASALARAVPLKNEARRASEQAESLRSRQ